MIEHIPITFEHQGKEYTGHFSAVSGAGRSVGMFHLMINNYYYGMLLYANDEWVFHGSGMEDMGSFFGRYVVAWYG